MEQEVPGGQSKGFKALPDNVYDCQQTVLKVGGGAGLQRAPRRAPPRGRALRGKSPLSQATTEDLKRSKPGRGLHLASSGTGCLEVGADLWSSTDKDPKSGMVELLAARSFGERETPALPGLLNY